MSIVKILIYSPEHIYVFLSLYIILFLLSLDCPSLDICRNKISIKNKAAHLNQSISRLVLNDSATLHHGPKRLRNHFSLVRVVLSNLPEAVGVRVHAGLHLGQQHAYGGLALRALIVHVVIRLFLPRAPRQGQEQGHQGCAGGDGPQEFQEGPVQGHVAGHVQYWRDREGKPAVRIRWIHSESDC